MTEEEKKSFFAHSVVRGPGKRQIKTNAAILLGTSPVGSAEDEEDEDFVVSTVTRKSTRRIFKSPTFSNVSPAEEDDDDDEDFDAARCSKSDRSSGSDESESSDSDSEGSKSGDSESDDGSKGSVHGSDSDLSSNSSDDEVTNNIEQATSDDEEISKNDTSHVKKPKEGTSKDRKKSDESISRSKMELSEGTSKYPSTSRSNNATLICCLCLNLREAVKDAEVIRCDRCGVAVHESCYIVDSEDDEDSIATQSTTEPWFCEPCLYGEDGPPFCELCPARTGAFKKADVDGCWVHLLCALYTPGITFGDIDRLSAVSWQELNFNNFGKRACVACSDLVVARTGIAVSCDAALCKNYYHVTCAQKLGLLVDTSDNANAAHTKKPKDEASQSWYRNDADVADPRFINCKAHTDKEVALKRKKAWERFYEQEQLRFLHMNRRVLTEREDRRRVRALDRHRKLMKSLEGVTIALPDVCASPHEDKRPRMLGACPRFLNLFADKAEAVGVSSSEFFRKFSKVDGSQVPYLALGFSPEFLSYFEAREAKVIPEMKKKEEELKRNVEDLKKRQAQLENELTELETTAPRRQNSDQNWESLMDWYRVFTFFGVEGTNNTSSECKQDAMGSGLQLASSSYKANQESPTYMVSPVVCEESSSRKKTSVSVSRRLKHQALGGEASRKNPLLQLKYPLMAKSPHSPKSAVHLKSPKSSKKTGHQNSAGEEGENSPNMETPIDIHTLHYCAVCTKSNDQHLLAKCDLCLKYFHLGCLDPPLARMPKKTKVQGWMCSTCGETLEDTSSMDDSNSARFSLGKDDGDSVPPRRNLRDRSDVKQRKVEEEKAQKKAFRAATRGASWSGHARSTANNKVKVIKRKRKANSLSSGAKVDEMKGGPSRSSLPNKKRSVGPVDQHAVTEPTLSAVNGCGRSGEATTSRKESKSRGSHRSPSASSVSTRRSPTFGSKQHNGVIGRETL